MTRPVAWAVAAILTVIFVNMSHAGSFHRASKPSCEEVELVVKGHINYQDSIMKSGELGFHHCMHKRLHSKDFPISNPNNPSCQKLDLEPEVVAINPPLPHDGNTSMPLFDRPNPYYVPDGTTCEVKYVQYYFRP